MDDVPPNRVPPPLPGRLVAIDYGTVRIGVALSDPEQRFCSPHENYTRRSKALDADYFRQLARDTQPVRFVVGLPVHLSGDESPKSTEARAFGRWLTELTGLPVVYCDERFTSTEAEQLLAASGAKLTKKQRKARLDKLAAHLLLSGYMESPQCQIDNQRQADHLELDAGDSARGLDSLG